MKTSSFTLIAATLLAAGMALGACADHSARGDYERGRDTTNPTMDTDSRDGPTGRDGGAR